MLKFHYLVLNSLRPCHAYPDTGKMWVLTGYQGIFQVLSSFQGSFNVISNFPGQNLCAIQFLRVDYIFGFQGRFYVLCAIQYSGQILRVIQFSMEILCAIVTRLDSTCYIAFRVNSTGYLVFWVDSMCCPVPKILCAIQF